MIGIGHDEGLVVAIGVGCDDTSVVAIGIARADAPVITIGVVAERFVRAAVVGHCRALLRGSIPLPLLDPCPFVGTDLLLLDPCPFVGTDLLLVERRSVSTVVGLSPRVHQNNLLTAGCTLVPRDRVP